MEVVKETPKFTVYELQTLDAVISIRGNNGTGIKDLRLLQSIAKKIKGAIPEQPKPAMPEDNMAEAAKMELVKKWHETMENHINTEVEVPLTPMDLAVIRQKFKNFQGFHTDEDTRDRVIALSDKLGIQ